MNRSTSADYASDTPLHERETIGSLQRSTQEQLDRVHLMIDSLEEIVSPLIYPPSEKESNPNGVASILPDVLQVQKQLTGNASFAADRLGSIVNRLAI